MKEEYNKNFNEYPHYVYATAFLVNGELADYSIKKEKTRWELRTFRGDSWENEVWEQGLINKTWNLTCEYNQILVKNEEEHNKAFDTLEKWLFSNFKIYQKSNLKKESEERMLEIEKMNRQILKKTEDYMKKYHTEPRYIKIPLWIFVELKKVEKMIIKNEPKNTIVPKYMDLIVCETVSISKIEEIEVF